MKEAHMTGFFYGYIRKNPPEKTTAFEFKIVKGTSMPLSSVAPHQISNLLACRTSGLYHKIPDTAARNGFTAQKPFDAWYITKSEAYLVLWFYKPNKPKVFYLIDILDWLALVKTITRKSVTEDIIKAMDHKEVTI